MKRRTSVVSLVEMGMRSSSPVKVVGLLFQPCVFHCFFLYSFMQCCSFRVMLFRFRLIFLLPSVFFFFGSSFSPFSFFSPANDERIDADRAGNGLSS